ncbi:hypothetical protein MTR67_011926 [Solanum verrucosum]|uniref:Uncharacterized protein n=1 Tax=Solanum verrucosum TaxID=315347 RepID=A0AAF0Q800_SOLVR|nr:hypothetical protein MTR67_011926 [Solanum verrucosum]
MRIKDSSSVQSYAMTGTPPLTHHFVHHDVSPSSTARPSATPDDEMPALAPGQKDRLGRVMMPDGSSWHPAMDAAWALKDYVRRLYTMLITFGARLQTEYRRVAEQPSMSETIQKIKKQVMNLARQPTTSAPEDTDDDSDDEDDYVDPTP